MKLSNMSTSDAGPVSNDCDGTVLDKVGDLTERLLMLEVHIVTSSSKVIECWSKRHSTSHRHTSLGLDHRPFRCRMACSSLVASTCPSALR